MNGRATQSPPGTICGRRWCYDRPAVSAGGIRPRYDCGLTELSPKSYRGLTLTAALPPYAGRQVSFVLAC